MLLNEGDVLMINAYMPLGLLVLSGLCVVGLPLAKKNYADVIQGHDLKRMHGTCIIVLFDIWSARQRIHVCKIGLFASLTLAIFSFWNLNPKMLSDIVSAMM